MTLAYYIHTPDKLGQKWIINGIFHKSMALFVYKQALLRR